MAVRLIDVAQAAGVAVTTASGILNNRKDSWASKETRERVLDAARRLEYRPNRAALGLKGKFKSIGLLVPDLMNPYHAAYAQAISNLLTERGYDLFIEDFQLKLSRERKSLQRLISHQVDGLICSLLDVNGHDEFFEKQAKARFPMVFVGVKRKDLPVDALDVDFEGGMRDVVKHLHDFGHREIAWVWGLAEGQQDSGRIDFLQRLAVEYQFSFDESNFISCGYKASDAYEAFKLFLKRKKGNKRPTAVVALNDWLALGVMRAASEEGISIPKDLSLVGMDDTEMGRLLPVALTTVSSNQSEMSEIAVSLILHRLQSKTWGPYQGRTLTTNLIVRESTGPVPKRLAV